MAADAHGPFLQEAHTIMCNLLEPARSSQEEAAESGCDCVRMAVPTHPGRRQEQTGAVLSAPPGTSNSTFAL